MAAGHTSYLLCKKEQWFRSVTKSPEADPKAVRNYSHSWSPDMDLLSRACCVSEFVWPSASRVLCTSPFKSGSVYRVTLCLPHHCTWREADLPLLCTGVSVERHGIDKLCLRTYTWTWLRWQDSRLWADANGLPRLGLGGVFEEGSGLCMWIIRAQGGLC